jgi:hypothetical protein
MKTLIGILTLIAISIVTISLMSVSLVGAITILKQLAIMPKLLADIIAFIISTYITVIGSYPLTKYFANNYAFPTE